MYNLLKLPSNAKLLLNEIGRLRPPYADGQALIRVRLDSGVMIDATWKEEQHECCIVAYKQTAGGSPEILTERGISNPNWVPGFVSSVVWQFAFKRVDSGALLGV